MVSYIGRNLISGYTDLKGRGQYSNEVNYVASYPGVKP